jgi:hypothetical protein
MTKAIRIDCEDRTVEVINIALRKANLVTELGQQPVFLEDDVTMFFSVAPEPNKLNAAAQEVTRALTGNGRTVYGNVILVGERDYDTEQTDDEFFFDDISDYHLAKAQAWLK